MRIAGSSFQFQALHVALKRHEVHETLRIWHAPRPAAPAKPAPAARTEAKTPSAERFEDVELLLLRLIIERLTGRKLVLVDADSVAKRCECVSPPAGENIPPTDAVNPAPAWGATYDREENYYEAESTQFTATGLVRTTDGKEIAISLALTMSREFMSTTGIHLRAGAAALKDPLVINFAGNSAQLTQTSLAFDLDVDGTADALPVLAHGSAYLALDRNSDGVINNGQELFGAVTGEGFAELARCDEDGNGWIDEGDSVFAQLRLWLRDEIDNRDYLSSLSEKGVGAIHLGAADSAFELKQGEELMGAVRSTGVYLTEEGGAGTIQQIDVKA